GRHDLSPLQARLLGTLARGAPPEPNVGLLARELDLAQPTVTDAVAGLERKGLVARAPDPTDRRRSRLCPTARGRRVADELAAADEALANA
ncbi:MarR family transcriptional regulator, partial [Acinetobacter baumannii]